MIVQGFSDSEAVLLGGMLGRPEDIVDEVGTFLHGRDFASSLGGKVFDVITARWAREDSVDPASVAADVGMDNSEPLFKMLQASYGVDVPIVHAKQIRRSADMRRYRATLMDLYQRADESDAHVDSILGAACDRISECVRPDAHDVTLSEMADRVLAECEEARDQDGGAKLGVSTGLRDLDEALTYLGLPRGQITTLAAQTSKGKSALAQAMARNAAAAGANVVHFTLEDHAIAVAGRALSVHSQLKVKWIARRDIRDPEQWHSLRQGVARVKRYGDRIHCIDKRPENVKQLLAMARRYARKYKADVVIFDYLQLIDSGEDLRTMQQHTDKVFGAIERFAGQHKDTATLLISQMNRHHGKPALSNLYHSAKLEQGSHTVILLWDPEVQGTYPARAAIVAKQKDGAVGLCVLGWKAQYTEFCDVDPAIKADFKNAIAVLDAAPQEKRPFVR